MKMRRSWKPWMNAWTREDVWFILLFSRKLNYYGSESGNDAGADGLLIKPSIIWISLIDQMAFWSISIRAQMNKRGQIINWMAQMGPKQFWKFLNKLRGHNSTFMTQLDQPIKSVLVHGGLTVLYKGLQVMWVWPPWTRHKTSPNQLGQDPNWSSMHGEPCQPGGQAPDAEHGKSPAPKTQYIHH